MEDRSHRQRINELQVRGLGPTAATGIRRAARRSIIRGGPPGDVLVESTEPIALVTIDRNIIEQARQRYPGYLTTRAELYAEGWKSVTRIPR